MRQRRESGGDHLRPVDLARFIHEVNARGPIFALGVQGHEPLLLASREHTQAILATGQLLDLPTTLVTNGVLLRDAVEWLARLRPDTIAISLDADSPAAHDRIRGTAGAWAATIAGIRRAVGVLAPRTHVAVASVLTSHRGPLDGMPALLRDLGITQWIITPLRRVGRNHDLGGPVGDRDTLYRDLLILDQAAANAGISFTVDDELDCLRHELAIVRAPEVARLHVRTLPAGVDLFRLSPSGHCSMNRDILQRVTPATPRWQPGEVDAAEFIDGLKRSAATSGETTRRQVATFRPAVRGHSRATERDRNLRPRVWTLMENSSVVASV